MFTRCLPISLSSVAVTGRSFSFISPLPAAERRRLITIFPSSSGVTPASDRAAAVALSSSPKTADTSAVSHPARISSFDVRSPSTAFIASITMDLPAPVSPVKTLNPAENSISERSITAMFSICRNLSIFLPRYASRFLSSRVRLSESCSL